MFSFFKRNYEDIPVPEWASFFTGKEYDKFVKYLRGYFGENVSYYLEEGEVHSQDQSFGAERLGLVNLAQTCKLRQTDNWRSIIAHHFDGMKRSALFENKFLKTVQDFSSAKRYLGVRLYHNDYVANLDEGLTIGNQLTDDIFAMLVFDFPETVRNVKPEEATSWNKSKEELFDIGLSNIRSKYTFTISKEDVGGINIYFIHGEHFFVPNIVFELGDKPYLVGSKGSLISIPHRHCAVIYPIENLEVVEAVNRLIPIVYKISEEGPGSISNSLYWYQDKRFITLPYELDESKLQFYPPEEFEELLNTLEPR